MFSSNGKLPQNQYFLGFTWITWIIILVIIIFIFWLIFGGRDHDFIGFPEFMNNSSNGSTVRPTPPKPKRFIWRAALEEDDRIDEDLVGEMEINSARDSLEDDEEAIFYNLSQIHPTDEEFSEEISSRGGSTREELWPPSHHNSHDYIGITPISFPKKGISTKIPESPEIIPTERHSLHQRRDDHIGLSNQRSNQFLYLSTPDRPPTGKTPRIEDLDIGAGDKKRSKAESRGERICRAFLEKYYSKPFPTIRPDFLVNPVSGRNLELDGYNPELNIAFEYNGYQHYTYPNRFHKTEDEFAQQVRRDKYKQEVCQMAGVYLINIPYTVPHNHIPQFIRKQLPDRVNLLSSSGR